MNVVSTFSGIGGMDEGLRRAGLRHVLLCENDPWRRPVLAEQVPRSPDRRGRRAVRTRTMRDELTNAGRRTSAAASRDDRDVSADLVCGGFPCQDLSVAGQTQRTRRRTLQASSSSSHGSPMTLFQPEDMSSLRTYPDFFPAKRTRFRRRISRRWPSSGFTTSPGESWTADTSECPNDGAASSSLADVLEATVAPKFFLSPKAAAGILRRAQARGRILPGHLAAALESVAGRRTPNA